MKIGQMLFNWWKRILCLFRRFPKKIQIRPKFSSSFIQYWYCQSWSYDRWIKEFRMLQTIGVHEIILQSVADTKSNYAVYPSKMKGYSSNSMDMLETALSAADSMGMNVRIGLGFNDDWWSFETHDETWLNHEAEVNSSIVTEIAMMYGGHQSIVGWYIPYEFNSLMALTHDQQANLNRFFRKIASTIKLTSTKSSMIAPYYNAWLSGPVTLALWSNSVRHVLKDTGIDIIALQDSIGAGFNTLGDLDEVYASTKKVADEIGLILYAVTETFRENESETLPASQRQIYEQLSRVSPYVSGFVAFSIDHYQNGNESTQVNGYKDYYQYYLN